MSVVYSRSLPPKLLLLGCGFFFLASFFAARFPDAPGASLGSYVSTLVMAVPAFVGLLLYLGVFRGLAALVCLSLFGYVIESLGVATGLPYGEFHYGDALGARLFGLVPYLLPLSYVPLVIGSFAAAWRLDGSRLSLVVSSAFVLVLMDGVLDPGAVSLGFWVWPDGGLYYGVPVSNFVGWLLSGLLASLVLGLICGPRFPEPPRPAMFDGSLLSLSFWVGAAVFGGMLLPAALGVGLISLLFHRRSSLARGRDKLFAGRYEEVGR